MACGMGGAALAGETLLIHGHIYTGNAREPWAAALAVKDARIEAVGSDAQILKHRTAHARLVDLHGRTVIPGIVDSHMHLLYGAYALHGLNLSTPASSVTPDQPDLLVERLRSYAAAHPRDAVVLGRADFSTVPPTTPTHALLDRAVPDRPVVIHNTSEHALWLNESAIEMSGLKNRPLNDPAEERGVIRDASGRPTGVLLEAAMQLAARAIAARTPVEDQLAMVEAATRYLNSFGITSVVNATGDLAELRLYATLRDRGTLTLHTRTAFGAVAVPHRLTAQFLTDLDEARRLYHDDWVSANLVKFFADGSTGLIPPLVYVPQDYEALVMALDERGYQLMTHALRADSVHMILDTYERLEQAHGRRDRRLRIEHADLIEAADLPRFAALGVIADMQPTFCCGEDGGNFDPAQQIPSDRWRSLEQSGATLAFSSDWPCTWPPDPFVSIQQAATRQVWKSTDTANLAGQPLDGAAQGGAVTTGATYIPAERITVEEAVRAYTQGSAYAAVAEDRVGSLEAGKYADLAVLSQDIFAARPEEIGRTRVTMTMVAGTTVNTRPLAGAPHRGRRHGPLIRNQITSSRLCRPHLAPAIGGNAVTGKNIAARGRIARLALILRAGGALLSRLESGIGAGVDLARIGDESEPLRGGVARIQRRQTGGAGGVADQSQRRNQRAGDEAALDHRATRNFLLHVRIPISGDLPSYSAVSGVIESG
jgi:predicted amidohydrolase YtcJ